MTLIQLHHINPAHNTPSDPNTSKKKLKVKLPTTLHKPLPNPISTGDWTTTNLNDGKLESNLI